MSNEISIPRRRGASVSSSHERARPLLGAYVLDALEPEDAGDVHAHLVACRACREEARQLADAAELLLGDASEPEPSEELWERIAASLRHRDQAGERPDDG